MRVAMGQFRELSIADLQFAAQLGASGITLNRPQLESEPWRALLGKHFAERPGPVEPSSRWEFADLLKLRTLVEAHGLRLECIENTPGYFYDKVMLGEPGADAQLEHYCATIRALGAAGITVLGYAWMPNRVWRTSGHATGRGGAQVSEFDLAQASRAPDSFGRRIDADTLWRRWEAFIDVVLPVAEAAGVTLALHPDDPPVAELGGVARIMSSRAAFDRAVAYADSPNHGLDFCLGTWAEMGVDVMLAALRHFGHRGRIVYAHVRNVKGCVPRFREAFVDDGDFDVVHALRTLRDTGFDGFLIDDHVPHVVEDTAWGHRSRAYATGYLKAVCRMLADERR